MAKKRVVKRKAGAAAKGEVNKSKAIRDYVAANPKDGPKAVAVALGEQGIDVSAAFVSTVKSTAKRRKKGRRVGRPRATKTAKAGATFTVSELLQAKKLSEEVGGIEKAKAAIDALAKLS
jgi:hypothetical protein